MPIKQNVLSDKKNHFNKLVKLLFIEIFKIVNRK
jgi:hypothetical protein